MAMVYLTLTALLCWSSGLSAFVLRRHLMMWKVFAPRSATRIHWPEMHASYHDRCRFLFEGLGFIVSTIALLIGVLVSLRVDAQLAYFVARTTLEKDA